MMLVGVRRLIDINIRSSWGLLFYCRKCECVSVDDGVDDGGVGNSFISCTCCNVMSPLNMWVVDNKSRL